MIVNLLLQVLFSILSFFIFKLSETARSQGLPVVLLGVWPVVWEVYCSAVTSPLCDIFLGIDIQRGIGRRAYEHHSLRDMWRERVLRMGTKVSERAQERTFAQNVTRTHCGGAVLFHISLCNIMLCTSGWISILSKHSTGPIDVTKKQAIGPNIYMHSVCTSLLFNRWRFCFSKDFTALTTLFPFVEQILFERFLLSNSDSY